MLVNDNTKIYAGDTEIVKAYQGDNAIYEEQVTPPYTELNYIESTGTQYIDTGYYATSDNLRLQMKFIQTNFSSHNPLFGCYISDGYYKTTTTLYGGRYYASNYNSTGATYSSGVQYEIDFQVNGNSTRTGTYSLTSNGVLLKTGNSVGEACKTSTNHLFTQGYGSSRDRERAIAKIYYLKFYDNGNLVLDFIPVLDENNVPCFYDKVSKTYFYNQGTGTFLYG